MCNQVALLRMRACGRVRPLGIKRLRDARHRLSNRPRPSVPPTRSSIRFSGCGIMPSTLSSRNRCPRWRSSSRWGSQSVVTSPSGVAVAEGDQAVAFEPPQRLGIGHVVALAMGDADVDDLALARSAW